MSDENGAATLEMTESDRVSAGLPIVGEPEAGSEHYELPPIKYPDDGIDPDGPAISAPKVVGLPDIDTDPGPTAEEPAKAAELPSHLLVQAKVFGLDPADFPTAAHLEGALAAQQKFFERFKSEETKPQARPAEPEPKPAAATADDFKLDPKEWDANTVKMVDDLNRHWSKKFEALTKQIGDVTPRVDAVHRAHQEQQGMQAVMQFDDTVAALGKDWEPVFGKGGHDEISRTSPAFQARDQAYRLAQAIQDGARKAGAPISWKVAVQRAAYAAFPEHAKAMAQAEVKASATKRQGQFTRPPTRRDPGPENPEAKALANLKRRYKAMIDD